MAFMMDINGGRTPNIDWSVGARGVNRRDDTMLVQHLLNLLFHEPIHGKVPGVAEQTNLDDVGALTVDGYWGPMTNQHVKSFEDYCVKYGGGTNDHVLDPVPNSMRVSRAGGHFKFYDLTSLVGMGLKALGASDAELIQRLVGDAPPLLQNALMCHRKHPAQYTYKPPPVPRQRERLVEQFDRW